MPISPRSVPTTTVKHSDSTLYKLVKEFNTDKLHKQPTLNFYKKAKYTWVKTPPNVFIFLTNHRFQAKKTIIFDLDETLIHCNGGGGSTYGKKKYVTVFYREYPNPNPSPKSNPNPTPNSPHNPPTP